MFWAFNRVSHYKPVRKMDVFMGTKTTSTIVLIGIVAKDCKGVALMIKSYYAFGLDSVGGASVNPFNHFGALSDMMRIGKLARPDA